MTNILKTIDTIINYATPDVLNFYFHENYTANDALELFIKDVFAQTLDETNEERKAEIYEQIFSYSGNIHNPPDLMLLNGDAIEIKKVESETSQIAFYSSFPSAKLYTNNPMLTKACRECEQWLEKDIIYAIGCVKQQQLNSLWLVYGDCYAASREIYEDMKKERIDPLGITSLRIRGMWQVEHPQKAYEYLNLEAKDPDKTFRLFALMRETKYLSFSPAERQKLESSVNSNFKIQDVKIKSPDNPIKRIAAKLISYQI
jgi:hypothetical protein